MGQKTSVMPLNSTQDN